MKGKRALSTQRVGRRAHTQYNTTFHQLRYEFNVIGGEFFVETGYSFRYQDYY